MNLAFECNPTAKFIRMLQAGRSTFFAPSREALLYPPSFFCARWWFEKDTLIGSKKMLLMHLVNLDLMHGSWPGKALPYQIMSDLTKKYVIYVWHYNSEAFRAMVSIIYRLERRMSSVLICQSSLHVIDTLSQKAPISRCHCEKSLHSKKMLVR